MTLSEPDVALTDFGLTVECAWFAAWLLRARAGGALRIWFTIFFAALAVAALLGGIVHGFLPDAETVAARALWSATLLAVGTAALAAWAVGACLLLAERLARRLIAFAGFFFVCYAAMVLLVSASFALAVANYALAGVFLLVAFVVEFARHRRNGALCGIAGLVLSFAAAAVQQTQTGADWLNLSHNALYHVIQALALLAIFLAARSLARVGPQAAGAVR